MTLNVELWSPVNPAVLGIFLGVAVVYIVYRGWKFIASSVTGTS